MSGAAKEIPRKSSKGRESAILELQRLKRMMETKEATIEQSVEERSDLKNHLEKVTIWADNHLTRLN